MKIKQIQQNIKTKISLAKYHLKNKYYNWKKPSIVNIKGVQIYIPKDVAEDLKQALYCGYYEGNELKIVASQIHPHDIVMELGTGLGLLSIFCAKKIGSDRIFTYEANPKLKSIIQQNYSLNQVSPHLKICILGNESGEKSFYVSDSIWDSSDINYSQALRSIQVPMETFNEEIKKNNPSFLIIDIEGGEYELCQYADFHNVKKLSMELHEYIIGTEKANFVKSKLKEAGFKLNQQFSFGERELFWERN